MLAHLILRFEAEKRNMSYKSENMEDELLNLNKLSNDQLIHLVGSICCSVSFMLRDIGLSELYESKKGESCVTVIARKHYLS